MIRTSIIGMLCAALFDLSAVAAETSNCDLNRDSQALLIGNKSYSETHDVPFAHRDIQAIRTFLIEKLCYRQANIQVLEDAGFNTMRRWLGRANNPRGRLWNRATANRSNIFVYYSGHGVPDRQSNQAYLLPVDADPNFPADGYSLDKLEQNLEALNDHVGPSRSVTLVLETSFSGQTDSGALQKMVAPLTVSIPTGSDIIRFLAAETGQVAHWDRQARLGLFTHVFLEAVEGKADQSLQYGNRDGIVGGQELLAYLKDRLASVSVARHGEEQKPVIPDPQEIRWQTKARQVAAAPSDDAPTGPGTPASDPDSLYWISIKDEGDIDLFRSYLKKFPNGLYAEIAKARIRKLSAGGGETPGSNSAAFDSSNDRGGTGNRAGGQNRRTEVAVGTFPELRKPATGKTHRLTIISWGGMYSESQRRAYDTPFLRENRNFTIRNIDASVGAVAAIEQQIKSGRVEWDLVDLEPNTAARACRKGLLHKIDIDRVIDPAPDGTPASRDFISGMVGGPGQECFVPNIVWSLMLAYRSDKLRNRPSRFCDIFDLQGFPGKRALRDGPEGNLEWALLCDGVSPDEIYETLQTDRGIKRALRKLNEIKSHLVWWRSGAQPIQILSDGEVVFSTIYNGRLFAALDQGSRDIEPIWDRQLLSYDVWAIPKGTPNLDAALWYLRFASAPRQLARQASFIAYGPARKSAWNLIGNHHKSGLPMRDRVPTGERGIRTAFLSDGIWWDKHRARALRLFRAWKGR